MPEPDSTPITAHEQRKADFLDHLKRLCGGVLAHDLEGRVYLADPPFSDLTGYSQEELLSMTVADLEAGFDPEKSRRAWETLAAQTPTQSRKTYRRRNGETFEADVWSESVTFAGRPAVLNRIQDVQKAGWVEQYVESLEDRFENLVHLIPDLVFRMRGDGLILEMFASGQPALLGLPAPQCEGRNVRDVFVGATVWRILESWSTAIHTRAPQIFDFKFTYGKHVSYFELRCLVGIGDEAVFIIRDVTERKTAEQKINELLYRVYDDNEELRKMAQVKDDFLSTVSHELRTPLTSILGYLRLLMGGALGTLTPQQNDCVGVAYHNAGRLFELVNNLLDLSRSQSSAFQLSAGPVRSRAVLEAAVGALKNLVEEKKIRLDWRIEGEPDLTADGSKLERVFINLLGNAVKFTPQEGRIELGARRVSRNGREGVLFHVRDNGVGIPAEAQGKLFQKFYQVDNSATRKVGGTGLGLAISKRIVDLHGGEIWVESREGEGSTFYVFLPDEPPEATAADGQHEKGRDA